MITFPRNRTALLAVAAALALTVAACGDDDDADTTSQTTPATTEATAPAETTAPEEAAGDPPAGGEDAVKQVILDHTFKGSCETMTDKFLETQAIVGDTREERCDSFKSTFQKPQYSEDDVKFRNVTVNGDTATATVGSDISNVEAEYKLVAEDGAWKIDEVGLG